MGEIMQFPETVEEFMQQYKIVDIQQVYTNGTELVPIFRMKQWFEAHKQRWIPCSERLPEKAGFYLVATPRGIEIMEFSSGDKRYRETPCFVSEALGKVSGYVTNWMPLPEPPKEGGNGNG